MRATATSGAVSDPQAVDGDAASAAVAAAAGATSLH